MDSLSIALCDLLETNNSTVRAACLRANVLPALLERHIDEKRVIIAVDRLTDVNTGRAKLQQYTSKFLDNFRSTCNNEVAQLTAKLLLKLHIWDTVNSMHLIRAFQLYVARVISEDTLAKLLIHSNGPAIANAFGNLPVIQVMTPKLCWVFLSLYTHRNDPALYAAHMARICESSTVDLFIRSKGDANACGLLNVLHARLTMKSYNPKIFTDFAPRGFVDSVPPSLPMQTVVSLLSRYIQLDNCFLDDIATTTQWTHFIQYLSAAIEQPETRLYHMAPVFLLVVLVRTIPGHDTVVEPLRKYIVKFPSTFNFQPTEDVSTIKRIIACGEKLNVDCSNWKSQLASIQFRNAQQERLKDVGVESFTQPHEFCCPMTMEVMSDPVVASDGHTYEKKALERIFSTSRISPLTREKLNTKIAIPNLNLKKRIRDYPDDLCDAIVDFKSRRVDENAEISSDT
jgi:hypothetical protein